MRFSLVAVLLAAPSSFAISPAATSPYDVVLPSLNGDPSGADLVVGQMYQDISTSTLKVVDQSGSIKTFAMAGGAITTDQTLTVLKPTTNTELIFAGGGSGGTGAGVRIDALPDGTALMTGLNAENNANRPLRIQRDGSGATLYLASASNLTQIDGPVTMSAFGAGTATFDSSGNVSSSSDERLKTDIQPFTTGLSALQKINPIRYRWNSISGMETVNQYVGFSAQNVQSALPEGVGMSAKGYLSLQERAIVATLVNAVKELEAEVKMLKAQK